LIKIAIGPQAFGEKPYSQDDIKASLDEFFGTILVLLDKKLERHQFLCGEEYTIVDFQLYNEISTVLTLHKKSISSRDFPNLFDWFN
jgi:glutathione S-transferase